MDRTLVFKQIYHDCQQFNGSNTLFFFTENDYNDERVTTMTEDIVVKWLFCNNLFRNFLIEEFFENSSDINTYFELTRPFTNHNQKPGDIDLLLVDKNRPDQVIAIECKKIKVTSIKDGNYSKVNNAKKVMDGIIQANAYQSLGFYQSYLMIIILDDSRYLDYPNTMMRNSRPEEIEFIYDIPLDVKIHNDVGVVYINITQPTGKDFNRNVGVGICIDKIACKQDQNTSMTNKVKELLKIK